MISKVQIPSLTAPPGYCPQAEDTSLAADLLDFYLLRQRSGQDRLRMAAALMRGARQLSYDCLSRQFTHLSSPQFARKLAEAWLQEDCPAHYIPSGSKMTWIQDSAQLATQLHQVFEAVGVPYYVTGGVAAITYGEPRTTRDLDVVVAVAPENLGQLGAALEEAGFYVPGMEDVGSARTLQITHIESISRADLMVAAIGEYEQLKFDRRRLCPFPDGTEIYVAAPEDLILNKLSWGQQSQSEKQWRDVLGVLKTQQEALDFVYLAEWGERLNLLELLERVIREAGVEAIVARQKNQNPMNS
jgi:hypothetical protein